LRKYKIEPNETNTTAFLENYLAYLAELLPQLNGRILPGVKEILDRLRTREDRVLGLLTGNLQRGAELKLKNFGLWEYFEFGAFADDHHDRNELGAFARARAAEKHGHDFDVARIDVIGDTEHDIACGRVFGARTIAVATGTRSRQRLAENKPDFLFDDFSKVDDVIATLAW
jgi:phosphoglycolate phosphatase-like HAD superfamily hydrolase